MLLSACGASEDESEETVSHVLSSLETIDQTEEKPRQVSLEPEKTVNEPPEEASDVFLPSEESEASEERATDTSFDFPDDVIILKIYRDNEDNQQVLTLKEDRLQLWSNQNVVCEKQIPLPADLSIGNDFYEIIGNPYISKDGRLVLIQSYRTLDDELKLDYTILAEHCQKIIPSLNDNRYVFEDSEGNYGVAFCADADPSWIGYPYEGLGFYQAETDFSLPKPTILWLDETTVKTVHFGSYDIVCPDYHAIYGISVRLDIEGYGELDIANVCDFFDPVEVDRTFLDSLNEKFSPEEYDKRFLEIMSQISHYKQKR